MLREASDFMVQLKKAEKAIGSMAAANVDAVSHVSVKALCELTSLVKLVG